jgi:phosphoglycerate dehydrogenase-like enzyme
MAGVDSLLTQPLLATAEDIILTNSSGIHAPKIAEYTLAMFLLFAQKIPAMMRAQAQSEWPDDRFERFMPRMLRDSTLGIVGYGSIGRETARLAHDFGMEVLATKRNVMRPQAVNEYVLPDTGDPEGIYVNRLYPPEALKSMLAASDFVQIAVPSVPATRKILGEAEFAAMRKHAVLVNVARGDVIDEAALIRALQTGQIGGAALDVFEIEPLPMTSPLWKMENVIISPHISGNTAHYNEDAAEVFAANLERYLVDEDLLNVINRTQGY